MATLSDYEPSIVPAEFVASWRQTMDPHPESSTLNLPNISDTGNQLLEQDDWSHYDDEDRAVTDAVYRGRAGEDSYAMESRFSVDFLRNRPPYVSKVLINTVFNE